ncbi:MAG: hypothetical protein ACK5XN_15735 [Bacteroidota bacterium]|jgi:hypothetical protein
MRGFTHRPLLKCDYTGIWFTTDSEAAYETGMRKRTYQWTSVYVQRNQDGTSTTHIHKGTQVVYTYTRKHFLSLMEVWNRIGMAQKGDHIWLYEEVKGR